MDKEAQDVLARELRLANRTLEEIKLALEGNTRLGIEGLVKKVNRHDSWITNMNLRMAGFGGAGAVVGTVFTFVAKDILAYLLKQ